MKFTYSVSSRTSVSITVFPLFFSFLFLFPFSFLLFCFCFGFFIFLYFIFLFKTFFFSQNHLPDRLVAHFIEHFIHPCELNTCNAYHFVNYVNCIDSFIQLLSINIYVYIAIFHNFTSIFCFFFALQNIVPLRKS